MSKTRIHKIGKDKIEVSEDTIINALERAGVSLKKKKHQFHRGDVVENRGGYTRIIVMLADGTLCGFSVYGGWCAGGQKEFENNGYKKIGELKDILPNCAP